MDVIHPERSDWGDGVLQVEASRFGNVGSVRLVESCALAYFHPNPLTRRLFRKRLHFAMDLLGPRPADDLLDAGCGIGYLLPTLAARARRVWAIDRQVVSVSFAQRIVARRNLRNVRLLAGDLRSLPFGDRTFDVVVSLSTFEHIGRLDEACEQVRRVAARGARVLVGFPLEGSFLYDFLQDLDLRIFLGRRWAEARRLVGDDEGVRRGLTAHIHDWRAVDLALGRCFRTVREITMCLLPRLGGLYAFRLLEPR
jgi:SAM-dependent methyltransferase